MCTAPKASVEHVPPKGLFPETKDLPSGVDLRKELITVPSCDIHNSAKSQDDEFLMYALVFGIQNNPTAEAQVKSKIIRALTRNAGVAKLMTQHHLPVQIEDIATGIRQETIALKVDMKRVGQAFDHIGRALHFHYFKSKWMGSIQSIPLFMLAIGDESSQEHNAALLSLGNHMEELLVNEPAHGANPEVFTYKVIVAVPQIPVAMLLTFYEGSKVVLLFKI
jgi:hypothetical protein